MQMLMRISGKSNLNEFEPPKHIKTANESTLPASSNTDNGHNDQNDAKNSDFASLIENKADTNQNAQRDI
jgi:hypothetical protein